ncbi:IclR family transcriptional regulator, partial [Neobacillus niacini]|uniref:IclR family transcriptional regulator n=1 Tax=Neobacillus niacini TaxID=86668 RepID=UPI0030021260
ASKILKLLSRYKYANSTLTQISDALEMNRSTCLRILKTLEEVDFVSFNAATKTYSLGSYLVILGSRAYEQIDYLSMSKSFLKRLTVETSLTSALVDRVSNDRLVYIAKEERAEAHRVNLSVGNQFKLTEISYGMWFLAYMDEKERMEYLSKGLRKMTPYTLTDVDQYLQKMEEAKEQGYLVSTDEYVMGISGVSAPIFNSEGGVGSVIACIGFSAMNQNEIENAVESVKRVASEFNEMLAFQYNTK